MRKIGICVLLVLTFVVAGVAQKKQPRTARDYFMLLPDKYFSLDCCMTMPRAKRKAAYLKRYILTEDNSNGYISAFADAAQEGMVLALFKRPDGTRLVGFYTEGEGGIEDTPWAVFLDYRKGRWTDVSRQVIPDYDKEKYIYELPRRGTSIVVYSKTEDSSEPFYRGEKLYELAWENGKFVRRKQ